MAMPFNMIWVVTCTMYIVIYDFNKLTFLYIHVHIFSLFTMTNKSVMTFISVNKMSVCLSVILWETIHSREILRYTGTQKFALSVFVIVGLNCIYFLYVFWIRRESFVSFRCHYPMNLCAPWKYIGSLDTFDNSWKLYHNIFTQAMFSTLATVHIVTNLWSVRIWITSVLARTIDINRSFGIFWNVWFYFPDRLSPRALIGLIFGIIEERQNLPTLTKGTNYKT